MNKILIALCVAATFFVARIQAQPADQKPAEKQETKAPETKTEAPKTEVKVAEQRPDSQSSTNKLPPGRDFMPKPNTNKVEFTNLTMKASYAIGVRTAVTVMMDGAELIDPELVIMGMRDVFYRYMPLLEQDDAEESIKRFEKLVQEHEAQKAKKEAEDNKTKGIAFLEENKKKEGVKVTDSGLQYKVLQEGNGESPTVDDRVAIHFRARNIDGIEFSNSTKRKDPMTIPVRSQIKAWREALLMMKPGSKYELFVSPDLAYGNREVGRGIGPNSTLIFELELVRVVKDEASKK